MRGCHLLAVLGCCAGLVHAAPFENLGFDGANLRNLSVEPGPVLRGTGPAQELLPGWQLSLGGKPQTTLGLNLDLLAGGYATLISADQSDFFHFHVTGGFALRLVGNSASDSTFSLTQRGDIPEGTRLLSYTFGDSPFRVSINGTDLTPVSQSSNSQQFDIAPFAGQTVNLAFSTLPPAMPNEPAVSYIDSITLTVPEPSVAILGLVAVAGVGTRLALARRRKH
jgi:hypothetical protein